MLDAENVPRVYRFIIRADGDFVQYVSYTLHDHEVEIARRALWDDAAKSHDNITVDAYPA